MAELGISHPSLTGVLRSLADICFSGLRVVSFPYPGKIPMRNGELLMLQACKARKHCVNGQKSKRTQSRKMKGAKRVLKLLMNYPAQSTSRNMGLT